MRGTPQLTIAGAQALQARRHAPRLTPLPNAIRTLGPRRRPARTPPEGRHEHLDARRTHRTVRSGLRRPPLEPRLDFRESREALRAASVRVPQLAAINRRDNCHVP